MAMKCSNHRSHSSTLDDSCRALQKLRKRRITADAKVATTGKTFAATITGNGTFQVNSNGLARVLFNGPVTVYTTPVTNWLGGLNGMSDLSGSSAMSLRVVGLVWKDPNSGNPVFVARSVEQLQ